ncbi:MAG: hypothetical protein Unbinned3907contig1000_26 [Prokaryotic dsDNA virus sp.]|nr:MAG: hypothetical protein Unbinned3907contig1000_26 [Prokaryotic dsDNA virus sp.]|tara:strand:- start:3164 stop:3439 length:276 start_codon:yes stop_codon:yes gene_type:complete
MITFEKVSDVHYKVFNYEVFMCSLEIHSDKYVVVNRYSRVDVPKSAKKHLKTIMIDLYNKDLKTMELHETADGSFMEGGLSIKKLLEVFKK